MTRRPRLDSSVSLEMPPPEMLQRSVTSVSDDKPPASPTAHRRNSRQYSLPVLNLGFSTFILTKEDHKRCPSPSKPVASPSKDKPSPSRHRRTPTKMATTRAFQRIAEDVEAGHVTDPGPHSSTDSDDEYSRSRRQMFPQSPKRHVTSYSLYLPDSCSGLKDQFLRIKERFTKPVVEQPGTSSRSDVTATTTTGPATSSPTSSASPEKPKTNSWRGMDPHDR
ncbi:hypothetical protein AaE_001632, partial [Aphanomyces astaci]